MWGLFTVTRSFRKTSSPFLANPVEGRAGHPSGQFVCRQSQLPWLSGVTGHAQKTGYGTTVSSAGLYVLSTSGTALFPELWRGWHRCPIYGWVFPCHSPSSLWPVLSLYSYCHHGRKQLLWPGWWEHQSMGVDMVASAVVACNGNLVGIPFIFWSVTGNLTALGYNLIVLHFLV